MSRRGENIHKRKDNRWEGRYIKFYDLSGKAKYGSVYGKTYFEVKKKLNEATKELMQSALPVRDHEITFREVLFLWLQGKRVGLKEQTYAKYLFLAETHIIPNIGGIQIRKINSLHINKLLDNKSKIGRINGNGGLSSSYIQSLRFVIMAVVEYAVAEGYCHTITGNVNRPGSQKHSIEVLSVAEQSTLTTYVLSGKHNDKKLAILLSLFTGMRIGEVCGLMWNDIDLDNGTIHVCHTVERIRNLDVNADENKTKLILGGVKTYSSDRIIPIPSMLINTLNDYKTKSESKFVLCGSTYEYTDPRSLQYAFHGFLRDCKLKDLNYHALRHTFATRCIEVGVDIKSLSEMLGHASVNITLNTYVHSSMDLKRIQIEKLQSVCGQ